ncbi:hypothetical protein CDEST_08811 [Colletotrichum destructivum]|uniref:Secreted protein n=1 Tax=Colletotrichum destructivum TaxID=34406 RepID=A0AAX4IKP6_9PEZI|nr:hypothetical protein CDEST_08811 [Colletotrichum destructivum]
MFFGAFVFPSSPLAVSDPMVSNFPVCRKHLSIRSVSSRQQYTIAFIVQQRTLDCSNSTSSKSTRTWNTVGNLKMLRGWTWHRGNGRAGVEP